MQIIGHKDVCMHAHFLHAGLRLTVPLKKTTVYIYYLPNYNYGLFGKW